MSEVSAETIVNKLRALGWRDYGEDNDNPDGSSAGNHDRLEPMDLGFWVDNARKPIAGFMHWFCHALGPEHSIRCTLTPEERAALENARQNGQELLSGRELDFALESLHSENDNFDLNHAERGSKTFTSLKNSSFAAVANTNSAKETSDEASKEVQQQRIARLHRRKQMVENMLAEKRRMNAEAKLRQDCAKNRRDRAEQQAGQVNVAINRELACLQQSINATVQDLRGTEHGPHLFQGFNQARRRTELYKMLDAKLLSSVEDKARELVRSAIGDTQETNQEALEDFKQKYSQARYAQALERIEIASLRAQIEDRAAASHISSESLAKALRHLRELSESLGRAVADSQMSKGVADWDMLESSAIGAEACLRLLEVYQDSMARLNEQLVYEQKKIREKSIATQHISDSAKHIEFDPNVAFKDPASCTTVSDIQVPPRTYFLPTIKEPKELTGMFERVQTETDELFKMEEQLATLSDKISAQLLEIDRQSDDAQTRAVHIRQRLATLQASALPPDRDAWITHQLLSGQ